MDLGVVSDEVLLLLGRPHGTPSAWWTPWLAGREPDVVEEAVASAAALLAEQGVLRDGRVVGPLADAAEVVRAAELVCTLVVDDAAAGTQVRASVVVAQRAALVDVQDPARGGHRLAVVPREEAGRWLAGVLDPDGVAVGTGDPVHVPAARLDEALPERWAHRVRLARVDVGGEPVQHLLTVLAHDAGLTGVWAEPEGGARVADVGDARSLANALLSPSAPVVAA